MPINSPEEAVPPFSPREVTIEVLQRRIRVARGEEPGDCVLRGGRVVNVFTQRIEAANVVFADGWIAAVGPFDWSARETIELDGDLILPGLIDAHMHLESTLLTPTEFARVVVPHGTAAVIADPHEVGNVLGVAGIEQLLAASEGLPLDVFFMAPSCVPCAPFEDAGATLDAAAVERLFAHRRILGLAEVMDLPAVFSGEAGMLDKIVRTLQRGRRVDGHAPGLVGRDIISFAAAGIASDHESTTIEEAREKARLGMLVQVREGSVARNLDTLLPLIVADELGDWCLCTDDIHADELIDHGHINERLRRVVQAGVPLPRAVRHAALVPARHYGFRDRGAVAPAYRADVMILRDETSFRPRFVFHAGRLVAREGELAVDWSARAIPAANSVHLAPVAEDSFRIQLNHGTCRVIRACADQILTSAETHTVRVEQGEWKFDPEQDVAALASLERHRASGRIGLALVAGFGFRLPGALGSSVAHDSHNLIVAGTDPREMRVCVEALERCGGGFVVVEDGEVVAELPLPFAGLLSPEPAEAVSAGLRRVNEAAARLGCPLPDPFGTLSFLALPVIPELRLTDRGLFDLTRTAFVPLEA